MSFCLVCPSCDWPAPPSDRPEDICPWCGEEMIDIDGLAAPEKIDP